MKVKGQSHKFADIRLGISLHGSGGSTILIPGFDCGSCDHVLLRIVQLEIDGAGLDGLYSMYQGNPSIKF